MLGETISHYPSSTKSVEAGRSSSVVSRTEYESDIWMMELSESSAR